MISTQANTAGHRFERLRRRLKNRHFGPFSDLTHSGQVRHRKIRDCSTKWSYDPRRPFWAGPMPPFFLLVLCGLGGVLSAFSKTLSSRFPCLVIAPVYTSPTARRVCSRKWPLWVAISNGQRNTLSENHCFAQMLLNQMNS